MGGGAEGAVYSTQFGFTDFSVTTTTTTSLCRRQSMAAAEILINARRQKAVMQMIPRVKTIVYRTANE